MKPLSFMNLSGGPVQEMAAYFKINPESELIIIQDDIDLEPGQLRIRKQGSAGGHNGLKDIIGRLGTQKFMRVKIGVGPNQRMGSGRPCAWPFSSGDRKLVDEAIEFAADAVRKNHNRWSGCGDE